MQSAILFIYAIPVLGASNPLVTDNIREENVHCDYIEYSESAGSQIWTTRR